MNSSSNNPQEPRVQTVNLTEETLTLDLIDGRTISVPLVWYPRLWYGTQEERENFEIFGDARYIHWPDLDEDLTVAGIVEGRRSEEGSNSFKKWLESRKGQNTQTV